MERFLLYLDDLDDLIGMVGLILERIRRTVSTLASCLAVAVVAIAGIWIALVHQPLALATVILLFVTLLYRLVTSPHAGAIKTA
jgi:hypothetical protein